MYTFEDAMKKSTDYFNGDSTAASVFLGKYSLKNNNDEILESTPEEMHKRLASNFARIEKKYNGLTYEEIMDRFSNFKYIIPQGSPMSAIGNEYAIQSASNCFVIPSPVDSYGGIFLADQQEAQIMKRRGGVGFDISNIRPRGVSTSNAAKTTDGISVFMDRFSNTCREVAQGGRRGALMLTISVHHPEIKTFIDIKKDTTRVTGANISIRLSDEFMNAVKNKTSYTQKWPVDSDNPTIVQEVDAVEIWNQIIHSAWASAEPGLLFWDTVKANTPSDIYGHEGFSSTSTNPCQPGWATVLTPEGIKTLNEINIGDSIWSESGWTTVVNKWSTGVKDVYSYRTPSGVFYGTDNHKLVSNGVKVEAKDCKSIDSLTGPDRGSSVHLVKSTEEGLRFGQDLSSPEAGAIPSRFFYGSETEVCGFLKGLYSAKGFVSGNSVVLETNFLEMASQVQVMLSSIGISSEMQVSGESYKVIINKDVYRFYNTIGFIESDKYADLIGILDQKNESSDTIKNDEIISVKYISTEEVFDITVSSDEHTYWTGGLNVSNCGEIVLPPFDSCRLMAINVYQMVNDAFTDKASFDYELLSQVAYEAMHLMDSMIDIEIEQIDKILNKIELDPETEEVKLIERNLWNNIKNAAIKGRRTGLGITGLGDALAALGIRYGSDESIKVTEDIYRTLAVNSYKATIDMAVVRGPFPVFDYELEKDHPFLKRIIGELGPEYLEKWKTYGRRNIALTTTAPTGSVSMLTQTTSGIEPAFSVKYIRRRKINPEDTNLPVSYVDQLGDKFTEYNIFHHGYKKWMDVTGLSDADYEKSPYFKSTANDVDWRASVDLQAAAQRWICHSISKTCNLPQNASEEIVAQVYMDAWVKGCKGFTVYRDGCRSGILITEKPTETQKVEKFSEVNAPKRPTELPCEVHHVKIDGQQWVIFVGLYESRPYEVFGGIAENIQIPKKIKSGVISKAGKKEGRGVYSFSHGEGEDKIVIKDIVKAFANVNYAFHTLAISGLLRTGMGVQYVLDIFNKADQEADIFSFNKVISRVLKHHIKDGIKSGEKCPVCGSELIFHEGCKSCPSCGYSKC